MDNKFSDLVTYFEQIAISHVCIKHSAKDKHFYRFELDEVISGMCSSIKYPALILEGYDFNYNESNSDNIRKRRMGAFILIDHVKDIKDYNRIHQVWDEMEFIGDEILVKMKADKESRLISVLRDFSIADCEGVPFDVRQLGQYGVRFTFNLGSPVNNVVDETRWL